MNNADLKQTYEEHALNWHPGFNESSMICAMLDDWRSKKVLEIGCGRGQLASMLAYAGADVLAIDYSTREIKEAQKRYNLKNLTFREGNFDSVQTRYDVIVMQGVLEHLDKPFEALSLLMKNHLVADGCAVLSVPHWVNPRGYVYHTLRMLLDAKMSLTDLHYFLPDDFQAFCEAHTYHGRFMSTDMSWASADECITDFQDRLPKALPDVPPENIENFLAYMDRMLKYANRDDLSGACLGVVISKKNAE